MKKSDENGNSTEQETVHQPHDKFFRTAMADRRVARAFFDVHLPKDLLKKIDLDDLELQPRSYINELREESVVDVLFKTKIAGKEAYLYLLVEHQSKPDKLMPFRLLKYVVNVITEYLDKTKKTTLPLVYPIVVYHANRPYPYTTDIRDLVDAPKELTERYFLKPFQLIDLGGIEDEVLKKQAWSGVMEFALKHIFARNIMPYLKDIAEVLHRLDQAGGRDYIAIVLQYVLERGELTDKDAFFKLIETKISPQVGEEIMSLAEKLREEGKLENQIETANRLLAEGVELVFIAKITGLTLEKVKDLQKKIIK